MRGRSKRDYSGYQSIKIESDIGECPRCGGSLRFAYRSDRHVAFLRNRTEILYDAKRCPNPPCDGPNNRYVPHELRVGMLKKYEYGLDVIAFIGNQRLRKHRTFADLGETLRRDYGVLISDRGVEDLFSVYLALLATDLWRDPVRLAQIRVQGRIVLALDAAQPEADGESLWVFRDTLSEEVLMAVTSASMNAATLAGHLRKIKGLGIPITGIISDAQNIILKAVQKVFPGVPHQLCQIHFLKDFAKPVSAADQALQQDLSKQLRGLSVFEKAAAEKPPQGPLSAPKSVTLSEEAQPAAPRSGRPRTHVRLKPPQTQEEALIVRDVCQILRAILKNHGRYPLETPGLETHDMLTQVRDALDEGLKKGELDFSSFASCVSTSTSP
jgi:hypothetical protein